MLRGCVFLWLKISRIRQNPQFHNIVALIFRHPTIIYRPYGIRMSFIKFQWWNVEEHAKILNCSQKDFSVNCIGKLCQAFEWGRVISPVKLLSKLDFQKNWLFRYCSYTYHINISFRMWTVWDSTTIFGMKKMCRNISVMVLRDITFFSNCTKHELTCANC